MAIVGHLLDIAIFNCGPPAEYCHIQLWSTCWILPYPTVGPLLDLPYLTVGRLLDIEISIVGRLLDIAISIVGRLLDIQKYVKWFRQSFPTVVNASYFLNAQPVYLILNTHLFNIVSVWKSEMYVHWNFEPTTVKQWNVLVYVAVW